MKPGNLRKTQGAKSGGKTKDEDSRCLKALRIVGALFFTRTERKNHGKKTLYF